MFFFCIKNENVNLGLFLGWFVFLLFSDVFYGMFLFNSCFNSVNVGR